MTITRQDSLGASRPHPRAVRWDGILRTIGPGILMAGAAIGVSHLVQSTRAGAEFGFQLVGLILLVTALKYPFFEFGHRYAAATGESMLHGYRRLGKPYLYTFYLITVVSALISVAAVTFVTAALAAYLLPGSHSPVVMSAVLLAVCGGLVIIGRYRALDWTVKVVLAALLVTTLVAVATAWARAPVAAVALESASPWNLATLGFLLALMGWMPLPIEASPWPGLWIHERARQSGHTPTLSESLFDFRLGYALMVVTAVAFTALGALVMHGAGQQFAAGSVAFIADLMTLYTQSIGAWSLPIMGLAAFTAMFSTTLTVIDIYPRALAVSGELAEWYPSAATGRARLTWMTCIGIVALLIIAFFATNLTTMADVAATFAFLAAPIFAALNFRLIMSRFTPSAHRPPLWLQALSWLGIAFLLAFSLLFVWAWQAGLVF